MELVLGNGFTALSFEDLETIDGGINWGSIAAGLSITGAFCIAIACAPASAFVGAAYGAMLVGSALSGAAAGICFAEGITG